MCESLFDFVMLVKKECWLKKISFSYLDSLSVYYDKIVDTAFENVILNVQFGVKQF